MILKKLLENNLLNISTVLFLFFLLTLSYQDFKYRAINLWTLFMLSIAGIFHLVLRYDLSFIAEVAFFNIITLSLLMLGTLLYYKLRSVGIYDFFNTYFGVGDLVMLFVMSPFLLSKSYIFIIVFSCVVGILSFFLIFKHSNEQSIPFAGLLSMLMFIIVLFADTIENQLINPLIFLSYGK